MEKISNLIMKCDICGLTSTCLCYQCFEYFCDSCYKFIHDKRLNSHHKKEKIDPYIPLDLKCREHPKVPNSLFCLDDKVKSIIINI